MLIQAPGADTLPTPAPSALLDSVVVEPAVPDPFVPIVQWIFQRPPWVMQLGIVIAALVLSTIVVLVVRRRQSIRDWLKSRPPRTLYLLAGGVVAIAISVAVLGWKANQYMMHDNNFCQGCHIFVPSGHAWVKPDTGTYLLVNALEGKHDTLSCHACHPFELAAQTRELYFWIVDRPADVPPHGKVPRDICEQCHVQGAASEKWQAIASTAGHRTHFESDSVKRIAAGFDEGLVNDEIACLTCHARSAHRFQPADSTCAQQGCHLTDEIDIRLGGMADQTGLHCSVCHNFTAEVPALATRDSAAGTLRPARSECLGCHEMRAVLTDFDPAADPHGGTCGMCHNPHSQVRPEDALKSCTTAGCHGDWKKVPFHTGAAHRGVAEQCQTCHQPHSARVDASECTACHTEVEERTRGRLRPPQPFDTTRALRQTSLGATVRLGVPPPDSFSHDRHRNLACLTCHVPNAPRSRLTFEQPRGCQICHHQAPASSRCTECHESADFTRPVAATITVTVGDAAPREREAAFSHPVHAEVSCVSCHSTPVALAPADSVRSCAACHAAHHEAQRTCADCHRTDAVIPAHSGLEDPHSGCTSCHAAATVAVIEPARSFCLGCHSASVDHYSPRECSSCHFLAQPAQLRPGLTASELPR
jgi:hypothetical protein